MPGDNFTLGPVFRLRWVLGLTKGSKAMPMHDNALSVLSPPSLVLFVKSPITNHWSRF